MDPPKVGILGGYGYTGNPLVRLLLEHTDTSLVIAGRNPQRAKEAAQGWNQQFDGERVRGVYADASVSQSLWEAFDGVDLLVVAAPVGRYIGKVARAALRIGCNYLDIVFSTRKLKVLHGMAGDIARSGRTFVTDAGYHPGLPALLVRYAGSCFDRVEAANVWSVISFQGGYPLTESLYEFVEELAGFQCMAYRDGQWHRATGLGLSEMRQTDFGFGFGIRSCVPMMLEEMRALPELLPSLRETGFYMAGFNWLVDWVVMPVMLLGSRIAPRLTRKSSAYLLHWATRCCSNPPFGVVLKLESCGQIGGERFRMSVGLFHTDPYLLTAAATVACVMQLLRAERTPCGLHFAAHLFDPQLLLCDLRQMGVKMVQETAPIRGECPYCRR